MVVRFGGGGVPACKDVLHHERPAASMVAVVVSCRELRAPVAVPFQKDCVLNVGGPYAGLPSAREHPRASAVVAQSAGGHDAGVDIDLPISAVGLGEVAWPRGIAPRPASTPARRWP